MLTSSLCFYWPVRVFCINFMSLPLPLNDEDDHESCNFYTHKNSDKLLNNQLHVYIYIYILIHPINLQMKHFYLWIKSKNFLVTQYSFINSCFIIVLFLVEMLIAQFLTLPNGCIITFMLWTVLTLKQFNVVMMLLRFEIFILIISNWCWRELEMFDFVTLWEVNC